MINILCSVNAGIINKPLKHADTPFKGPWQNIELSPEELMLVITEAGWAIAAQGTDEFSRLETNFKQTNLIMIDIDNEVIDKTTKVKSKTVGADYLTLEQSIEHPFYKAYGFGYYVSSSFTPGHHKYRLLFATAMPLTSPDDVSAMRYVLNSVFKGDNATTDSVRLFFSNNFNHDTGNATPAYKLDNNIINPSDMLKLITEGKTLMPEVIVDKNIEYSAPDDFEKKYIIKELCKAQVNNWQDWIHIGYAMQKNGFTETDFVYVTVNGLMSAKTQKDARSLWKDLSRRSYTKITMGTVWHHIGGMKKFLLFKEQQLMQCIAPHIQQQEDIIADTDYSFAPSMFSKEQVTDNITDPDLFTELSKEEVKLISKLNVLKQS